MSIYSNIDIETFKWVDIKDRVAQLISALNEEGQIDTNQLQDKTMNFEELIMNEGLFSKEEYEAFRKFREQISKLDNLKILLEVK